jgi:hypothetical protein
MTYRVAADVLRHLLPIDAGKSPETLRSHTLQVGEQLGDAAADKPPGSTIPLSPHRSLPAWSKPRREDLQPVVVTPQGGLIPEPNAPRRQKHSTWSRAK